MSSATTPLFSAKNVISPNTPPTNGRRAPSVRRVSLPNAQAAGREAEETGPHRGVVRVGQLQDEGERHEQHERQRPEQHPADVDDLARAHRGALVVALD